MDEYEQLQRLRELWSKSIETWGQIMIPLGAAIVAYFLTLAAKYGWNLGLLFVGWVLFAFCLVFWRCTVHHIDRQIVGLYPAMLRLEQERKWETQTRYYYDNLRWESLLFLGQQLGLTEQDTRERLQGKYENFQIEAKGSHYGLLRLVWIRHGYRSLGDRGHGWQDRLVIGVLSFFLTAIFSIFFLKEVTQMPEEIKWVIALVFAFLGIALTMVATAWSGHWQAAILEKPDEKIRTAKSIRKGSYFWCVGAAVYFVLAMVLLFALKG